MTGTEDLDNQAASTSPPPVYQQLSSSQIQKRKISSTQSQRQTRRRVTIESDECGTRDELEQPGGPQNRMEGAGSTRDELGQPGGPQNCMEGAGGTRDELGQPGGPQNLMEGAGGTRNELGQPGGPQNHMEDAGGTRDELGQPGGPQNHMEGAEGDKDDLEQPWGPQPCRERGRRARRRLPLWQWNRIYPRGPYLPRNIHFTGNEGIQVPMLPNPTTEDFFKLYINAEIIDHIVTQTNLYAQQYTEREQNNLRPHSLVKQWKPTGREEMIAFIAILIMMGIIHKPRIKMYWYNR